VSNVPRDRVVVRRVSRWADHRCGFRSPAEHRPPGYHGPPV